MTMTHDAVPRQEHPSAEGIDMVEQTQPDSTLPHRPYRGVLAVQVIALVLLVGASLLGQFALFLEVPLCVAAMAAFTIFWPFRGTWTDRVLGVLAGLISLVFALNALGSGTLYPSLNANDALTIAATPLIHWACVYVMLLALFTVIGFARQMARKERTDLLRSLSQSLTGVVAMASMPGWLFVVVSASCVAFTGPGTWAAIVVSVIALALMVLMVIASRFWLKDFDPDPAVPAPWVGIALLSVMLLGLVAFAATLALLLCQYGPIFVD